MTYYLFDDDKKWGKEYFNSYDRRHKYIVKCRERITRKTRTVSLKLHIQDTTTGSTFPWTMTVGIFYNFLKEGRMIEMDDADRALLCLVSEVGI